MVVAAGEELLLGVGDEVELARARGVGLAQAGLLVRQAETLRQNGVNFHDLTMLFKNQSRTIYRDKCCHYNQTGYDLVAERIGTILAREWNKGDR